jgi:hypothetical protein
LLMQVPRRCSKRQQTLLTPLILVVQLSFQDLLEAPAGLASMQ